MFSHHPTSIKTNNKANRLRGNVVEACAELINKVIPKNDAPEDRAKIAESSPGVGDPKWALKIKHGLECGNTIKTNWEDCVIAQSLKLEEESLKRSIKTM